MSAGQAIIARIMRDADPDDLRAIINRRPITTNSVSGPGFDPAIIQQDFEATRIVIHERFPQLVNEFLSHKRQHGSQVERALYSDPAWTWQMQVARLSMKIHGVGPILLFLACGSAHEIDPDRTSIYALLEALKRAGLVG